MKLSFRQGWAVLVVVAVVLVGGARTAGAQTWDCGEVEGTVTATLSEGVLTISGTGKMKGWGYGISVPWLSSFGEDITKVIIVDDVTSIGDYAFLYCSNLTSITIPNSVTFIGEGAFYDCAGLTSITIPNSVTSIGGGAFSGCRNLTSVTIPNSVTSIGGGAFSDCAGLASINIGVDNTRYSSENGVLFNKDKTEIIGYPGGKQGAYSIPNSVTSIGGGAFSGCRNLTSFTIPDSVTSISEDAFGACFGLTSITIPNGVTSIGADAFSHCTSLTSITIPIGVNSIGASAFSNCISLTSITIPDSVISIGARAFFECTGLASINVGNSVISIGNSTFSQCTSLTSINVGADNTTYSSENGVLFNKNKTKIIEYPCGKQGAYSIPNGVTSIGREAFSNCTDLTSITIPNSVDSIGEHAFSSCVGLTSITIGNSVTFIGMFAFTSCTGLTSITSLNHVPPTLGINVFFNGNKTKTALYVPQSSTQAYKSTPGWSDFKLVNPTVTDITGVPTAIEIGLPFTLTGTIVPEYFADNAITWSVENAGATGAGVYGGVFLATSEGTVVLKATIADGKAVGTPYEQFFFINAVVSVASNDRVVPQSKPSEAAVVVPVNRLATGFTAGPNPAGALRATPVQFFRSGSQLESATLSVYDASGNAVRKIAISDKAALGNSEKRVVGSWNLKDAKGRQVPEGMYLVKGTIKTKGGKKENVSAVVGVR